MRLAIATDCFLFAKYELDHDRHVPEIPYKQISLSLKKLRSIVSNAEDRSNSFNKDTCLLLRPKRISFAFLEAMSLYYGEAFYAD